MVGRVAGGFGDADGVRALGRALLSAGRGLSSATDDLSGCVQGLVPSGWSGSPADAFGSDWTAKAQQAGQLAAICQHVGQVLTALAGELDAAGQQAARAQQMTGGPASRFALPSTEQQTQHLLNQASGAAQRARSAARAKLAGIAVPKIGPPLTARQVTSWADRLAPPPKPSQPWYESLWHGAESGGLGMLKGLGDLVGLGPAYGDPSFGQSWAEMWQSLNDFSAGFDDGALSTVKGLGDLVGLGPGYGEPSFTSTWGGIAGLVEPWHWDTFAQSWTGLGNGLVAWDEWKTDPSHAEGEVAFNLITLPFAAKKLADAGDAALAAARASRARAAVRALDPSRMSIGTKIAKQIGARGWTRESIDETVQHPARTVTTRDTRWKPDGTRNDAPATAYVNKDGSYVIVNDDTGDIVQVSNRNDPNWKAPWE